MANGYFIVDYPYVAARQKRISTNEGSVKLNIDLSPSHSFLTKTVELR